MNEFIKSDALDLIMKEMPVMDFDVDILSKSHDDIKNCLKETEEGKNYQEELKKFILENNKNTIFITMSPVELFFKLSKYFLLPSDLNVISWKEDKESWKKILEHDAGLLKKEANNILQKMSELKQFSKDNGKYFTEISSDDIKRNPIHSLATALNSWNRLGSRIPFPKLLRVSDDVKDLNVNHKPFYFIASDGWVSQEDRNKTILEKRPIFEEQNAKIKTIEHLLKLFNRSTGSNFFAINTVNNKNTENNKNTDLQCEGIDFKNFLEYLFTRKIAEFSDANSDNLSK